MHPQIPQWTAEPLEENFPARNPVVWYPHDLKTVHVVPDAGGAYYNFYGANFDGSNQVPAKAPGKLDYNRGYTSSGFFGVQPQDMPSVCLMPAVEFSYSSLSKGQQHTNWTNGDNNNFTIFNPSMLLYTSTTTTTTADMLGGLAGGGMEGGASSVTTTTTATRSTSSLLPADVIGPKRIVIQNKAHLGPFKTFIGSHRYGLNITIGTLNRPCRIIFHKDNYIRCVHPATDKVALRSPYNPLLTAPITQNGFELNPRQVVLHNINVEAEKGGMHQRQTIKIHGRSTEGVTSAGINTPDDVTRRKLEDDVEDYGDRVLAGVDVSWVNSPDVLARLRALEEQKAQGLPSDFDLLRNRNALVHVRRGLEDEDAGVPLLTLPEYAGGLPYYGEDIEGGKDSRLWDLDRGIVRPIIPEERELWFLDILIRACPQGMVRASAGEFKCFPCPAGQYSTYGRLARESEINLKTPIFCRTCWMADEGRYQDERGATECKKCPLNSFTTVQATRRIDDCLCGLGYFTPFYGKIMKPVDDPTYIMEPFLYEHLAGYDCLDCGRVAYRMVLEFPQEKYMDEKYAAPVRRALCDTWGGLNYVPQGLCRAYCPGGIDKVVSQKYFSRGPSPAPVCTSEGCRVNLQAYMYRPHHMDKYHETHSFPAQSKASPTLDVVDTSAVRRKLTPVAYPVETFTPSIETCQPPVACLGYNLCSRSYIEEGCRGCRFKYYRDKNGLCVACGYSQVLASLIMTGIGTFATVGAFIGMIAVLKFKSDLRFKVVIKLVIKVRIIRPILREIRYHHEAIIKCVVCCCPKRCYKKKIKTRTLFLQLTDFGENRMFQKYRQRLWHGILDEIQRGRKGRTVEPKFVYRIFHGIGGEHQLDEHRDEIIKELGLELANDRYKRSGKKAHTASGLESDSDSELDDTERARWAKQAKEREQAMKQKERLLAEHGGGDDDAWDEAAYDTEITIEEHDDRDIDHLYNLLDEHDFDAHDEMSPLHTARPEDEVVVLEEEVVEEGVIEQEDQEDLGADADGNPIIGYDEDGNPVIGHDEEGNPIFGTPHEAEQDADGNPIIGYDEDGNPVIGHDEEGNYIFGTVAEGEHGVVAAISTSSEEGVGVVLVGAQGRKSRPSYSTTHPSPPHQSLSSFFVPASSSVSSSASRHQLQHKRRTITTRTRSRQHPQDSRGISKTRGQRHEEKGRRGRPPFPQQFGPLGMMGSCFQPSDPRFLFQVREDARKALLMSPRLRDELENPTYEDGNPDRLRPLYEKALASGNRLVDDPYGEGAPLSPSELDEDLEQEETVGNARRFFGMWILDESSSEDEGYLRRTDRLRAREAYAEFISANFSDVLPNEESVPSSVRRGRRSGEECCEGSRRDVKGHEGQDISGASRPRRGSSLKTFSDGSRTRTGRFDEAEHRMPPPKEVDIVHREQSKKVKETLDDIYKQDDQGHSQKMKAISRDMQKL